MFDFILFYRCNYSCEIVLLWLIEDWKCCCDNKEIVVVVFMDLFKVFDIILYLFLFVKLKVYGFSDISCKFLDDYLIGRI